jgi:hypothetical protein
MRQVEGIAEPNAIGPPPPRTGAGRRLDWQTEKEAMRIVRDEEEHAGRRVELLTKPREKIEGCDFLSHPPDGGPPDRVEVKGMECPLHEGREERCSRLQLRQRGELRATGTRSK